jgi:hypothetical protein
MDTAQPTQNSDAVSVQSQTPVQPEPPAQTTPAPIQSGPVQPQAPAPTQGAPSIHREQEVVPVVAGHSEVAHITETAPKIELGKEVAELGVEAVHERPDLTLEDKKLGVGHAGETIPAFPAGQDPAQPPPMTLAKAQLLAKSGSWKESVRYYYTLVVKKLKREEAKEKKHGH